VARLAALAVLVLGPWVAGGPAAGARPPLAGPGVLSPGSLRDSCRDPVDRTFGVEFRRGELWTLAIDGTLTRLSGCAPAQILSVNGFRGFATGLGWDSRRDLFVVTDAEIESLYVVDLAGEVVRVLGAPGSGSIGAAYDSTRDVYWITDFETDSLYGLNPLDGGRVAAFALPAGSRCAGAAYDPGLDAVFYQDRVLVPTCYFVSAADGSLLGQFQLPYPGLNGWEDNALAPDGSLWAHHFERGKVYAFERSVTSTRRVTWGGLKQRFR
jgi:hypothetical protein